MEFKHFLLFAGTLLCTGMTAQTVQTSLNRASTDIQPRLHSITAAPQQTTHARQAAGMTADNSTAATAPVGSRPALADTRQAGDRQQLDSIVTLNTDGSNAILQCFTYNDMGKETQRKNYYWSSETASWGDPVEQYDFTWNDDGLILVEQAMGYGTGQRKEYTYNEQGLGIQQINYQLGTDGEWEPVSKGNYDYDEAGNIIEEMLYVWNGSQWTASTHNYASWDEKKRQTSYTGYTWDGSQWVGTSKGEYTWFDGPRSPEYVEGTNPERMTYKADYTWKDGRWQHYYIFTNSFNDDGRLSGQSELCYNRQSGKWCGGDYWDGLLGYCKTWKSRITYDDHGATILSESWECLPDSTGWLKLAASPTTWEYDEAGNREGLYRFVQLLYDAQNNLIGEKCTQQTYYAYNADNQRTWVLEQLVDENGETESLFEEKYGFNEQGLQTYTYIWDWVDGKRTPTSRTEYTYNDNGELIETVIKNNGGGLIPLGAPATRGAAIEDDDNDGWVNSSRWTYEYENSTLTDKRGYRWTNGEWTTNTGQTVSYDFDYTAADIAFPEGWTDPYKINWIQDLYSDGSNGWMASTRTYYYSEPTATAITAAQTAAGTETGLSLSGDYISTTDGTDFTLKIYSIDGTLVRESAGNRTYIGDLPAGIYVASRDGQKVKFVKH